MVCPGCGSRGRYRVFYELAEEAAAIRHNENARRAVQVLAVAICSEVTDSPQLEQYSLRSLTSGTVVVCYGLLSSAMQEELAKSLSYDDLG